MKVSIRITVDVDAGGWAAEYGMTSNAEVREDVRLWATTQVVDELRDRGLLREDSAA